MGESIHKGHRDRQKEKFLQSGFAGFGDAEVLELLLFYAIPFKDVNPTVHALLARFGSVANVLDAGVEELCMVKGISRHTALMISMMPKLFRYYEESTEEVLDIEYKSKEFYKMLIADAETESGKETLWLYLFDRDGRFIRRSMVHRGSLSSVTVDYRAIIEPTMSRRTASIVLMHNHPDGSPYPSTQDIETTREVYQIMSAIGIPLSEHYIVAGKRIVGITHDTGMITLD